jgi:hypothetical protein
LHAALRPTPHAPRPAPPPPQALKASRKELLKRAAEAVKGCAQEAEQPKGRGGAGRGGRQGRGSAAPPPAAADENAAGASGAAAAADAPEHQGGDEGVAAAGPATDADFGALWVAWRAAAGGAHAGARGERSGAAAGAWPRVELDAAAMRAYASHAPPAAAAPAAQGLHSLSRAAESALAAAGALLAGALEEDIQAAEAAESETGPLIPAAAEDSGCALGSGGSGGCSGGCSGGGGDGSRGGRAGGPHGGEARRMEPVHAAHAVAAHGQQRARTQAAQQMCALLAMLADALPAPACSGGEPDVCAVSPLLLPWHEDEGEAEEEEAARDVALPSYLAEAATDLASCAAPPGGAGRERAQQVHATALTAAALPSAGDPAGRSMPTPPPAEPAAAAAAAIGGLRALLGGGEAAGELLELVEVGADVPAATDAAPLDTPLCMAGGPTAPAGPHGGAATGMAPAAAGSQADAEEEGVAGGEEGLDAFEALAATGRWPVAVQKLAPPRQASAGGPEAAGAVHEAGALVGGGSQGPADTAGAAAAAADSASPDERAATRPPTAGEPAPAVVVPASPRAEGDGPVDPGKWGDCNEPSPPSLAAEEPEGGAPSNAADVAAGAAPAPGALLPPAARTAAAGAGAPPLRPQLAARRVQRYRALVAAAAEAAAASGGAASDEETLLEEAAAAGGGAQVQTSQMRQPPQPDGVVPSLSRRPRMAGLALAPTAGDAAQSGGRGGGGGVAAVAGWRPGDEGAEGISGSESEEQPAAALHAPLQRPVLRWVWGGWGLRLGAAMCSPQLAVRPRQETCD